MSSLLFPQHPRHPASIGWLHYSQPPTRALTWKSSAGNKSDIMSDKSSDIDVL
ncbi:hypothetical protein ABN584_27585 [Gloeocapsa sp. BRSZ]